ncbi:hypothetical protein NEMIN01_0518 [Nematocida minor]|uniref:uncharacterized protein n=1 Tax=Nematocida minor TaxID=1912983 RepID=UPI002220AD0D|nr:uncharacterized protein NEMIN01_0518 [Nematocida minor]KAI5189455.1 hypothetical protein NEMIN01_0518 [Nematocida minor]
MSHSPEKETDRLKALKKQAHEIASSISHSRMLMKILPKDKNALSDHIRDITDKHTSQESVVNKILKAINRNKGDWKYISEQSVGAKAENDRIVDRRKLSLKKKYIVYSKYKDLKEMHRDAQCSICFQKYISLNVCGTLRCRHTFHKRCINSHIAMMGSCPICRRDVISGLVN